MLQLRACSLQRGYRGMPAVFAMWLRRSCYIKLPCCAQSILCQSCLRTDHGLGTAHFAVCTAQAQRVVAGQSSVPHCADTNSYLGPAANVKTRPGPWNCNIAVISCTICSPTHTWICHVGNALQTIVQMCTFMMASTCMLNNIWTPARTLDCISATPATTAVSNPYCQHPYDH